MRYAVTTAITSYETYYVDADSMEEARGIVRDGENRATLESIDGGESDDLMIIEIRAIPASGQTQTEFLKEIHRRLAG